MGVGKHATHFGDEVTKHDRAARGWLCTVIGLASVTFGLAGLNIWFAIKPTELGTSQAIQLAVAKVLFSRFSLAPLFGLRVFIARTGITLLLITTDGTR